MVHHDSNGEESLDKKFGIPKVQNPEFCKSTSVKYLLKRYASEPSSFVTTRFSLFHYFAMHKHTNSCNPLNISHTCEHICHFTSPNSFHLSISTGAPTLTNFTFSLFHFSPFTFYFLLLTFTFFTFTFYFFPYLFHITY